MTCECLCQIPSEQLFYYDKTPPETCVICMEYVNERDRSVLKCGHEFHTSCLMSHVIKCSNKCPLCRDEISEKVEERPNLNDLWLTVLLQKTFLAVLMVLFLKIRIILFSLWELTQVLYLRINIGMCIPI